MRKQFVFIFLLFAASQLSAQQTDSIYSDKKDKSFKTNNLSFGFKLSPSISWIRAIHNDVQSDGAALKFGMGGIVAYHLSPAFSFVSGFNYNEYGGYVFDNASQSNPDTEANYLINYSEFEIPVALKLQTKAVNKTSYYLQAGLALSFVSKATEKHKSTLNNTDPEYIDIKDLTFPNRISYQLGAGVEYSIGKRAAVFGQITFKNALTNSANSNRYLDSERYDSPLQLLPGSMEFSVGILF